MDMSDEACPSCYGEGKYTEDCPFPEAHSEDEECPYCDSTGEMVFACEDCDGTGKRSVYDHKQEQEHVKHLLYRRYKTDEIKSIRDYWTG